MECHFEQVSDLAAFLKSQALGMDKIFARLWNEYEHKIMNTNFHTSKALGFESLQNQQWRFSGLCDVSSLKYATQLDVMINKH